MLLIPLLASASGCVTALVITAAAETETKAYIPQRSEDAWLDNNGYLTVCLFGQLPEGWTDGFSVSAPVADMTASNGDDGMGAYRVPPKAIRTPCLQQPEGARAIPVEFVAWAGESREAGEQGWQRYPDREWSQDEPVAESEEPYGEPEPEVDPEEDPEREAGTEDDWEEAPDFVTMPGYMDQDSPGAKIYLFENEDNALGATVIYRHETPPPEGTRYVRLDLPITESQPNLALILLVPVTLALDVLVLYLCVELPGSCS
jgi:hypothetical protein